MKRNAMLAALALLLGTGAAAWAQQGLKITPVLESTTTMTGQPIEYLRTGEPKMTVHLVEVAPGGEIGRHMHRASGAVYLLEGTLLVEMEDGARHEFKPGQAFLEATNTWHNARNAGSAPVKFLVVTPGEAGKSNIVRPEAVGAAPGTTTTAPGTPGGASGAAPGAASGAQPTASPQ